MEQTSNWFSVPSLSHCTQCASLHEEQSRWEDVTWPDDWTSATMDGKRSAQFKETLLVTDTKTDHDVCHIVQINSPAFLLRLRSFSGVISSDG
eukprot:m.176899 g.176899  ORF g.176899 m.176899 type:complete len:93 (+) comp39148_c0_seq42:552-830(+)